MPVLSRQLVRALSPTGAAWLVAICGLAATSSASAQERYYPLDQTTPPGVYGNWSGWQQRVMPRQLQSVSVQLPVAGSVAYYSSSTVGLPPAPSPARARLALGGVYRLRLADLEGFPGVELYPTIELVDVLHPPQGLAEQFPIPVVLTIEELNAAVAGQMVTKVVYLEPAQELNPLTLDQAHPNLLMPPQRNIIEEADRRGRPLLILRVGSRVPNDDEPEFFGQGAPLAPAPGR